MNSTIPAQPANSTRITLNLENPESRMDNVLLNAMREQDENEKLKAVSRTQLKEMFLNKRILIKFQTYLSHQTAFSVINTFPYQSMPNLDISSFHNLLAIPTFNQLSSLLLLSLYQDSPL